MAYSFQTFIFKAVLTSAQMNQVEVNIRDHVHGTAGVGTVPDTGLTANVSLKNIDNLFSAKQSIILPDASFAVHATTGSPIIDLQRASVLSVRFKSGSSDHLEIQNSGALTRVQWDLSTNPGTLTLGSIPDARLTTNVPLLNVANVFTATQTLRAAGNPGFFLDATTGSPFFRLQRATLNAASITAPAVNTFNILDNLDGVRVSWDLSTNPGTLVTGSIPDARLTANVALLNAGNVFTVDQTVRKASAISIIDATTGNPLLRMQRAAVNSVAIDSTATNILNFKNNADAARVSWDLSGTVGKLTQGDVPLARLEGQEVSKVVNFGLIGASSSATNIVGGFTGLSASDYFIATQSGVLTDNHILTARFETATSVRLMLVNNDTSGFTTGSMTFYVRAIKRV